MLGSNYIQDLPDDLVELYARVEQDILSDMARRISTYDYWIPSVEHQAKKLEELGLVRENIVKKLSSVANKSQEQIRQMMKEAGTASLKSEDEVYRRAGMNPPPLRASPEIRSVLNAGLKQTNRLFRNLTKTTAKTTTKQFEDALDRAYMQISSGAFSPETAVRQAVKQLSRQGVGAVVYPTGHVDSIEVAVRRAVTTGVNATQGRVTEARRGQMGANLVEVSAHGGARPSHALWQGGVYWTIAEDPDYPDNFYDTCQYGSGAGIYGWNCSHEHHVYFKGAPRAYTGDVLDRMEEKRFEYNGRKMTEYEAHNQQRYVERQIRRWNRENAAMKAAGLPADEASAKMAHWQTTQRDFIKQTGLKRQSSREQISPAGVLPIVQYKRALKNEPEITKTIKKVGKRTGMDVVGLEYRLKSKKSYMRKIASKEGTPYEAKDIIRYTYTAEPETLSEKILNCIDELQKEGYNVIEIKNTWRSKINPYHGVNATVKSPVGQKFELQFHTPESFELKNGELHELYEKQRLVTDKTSKEFLSLRAKMFKLSRTLVEPADIERIH